MQRLLRIFLLLFLLISQALADNNQPNILFILTDDQGYGDLQAHGHPYLKTPHLNRLHAESVRFDNFYVSPSCAPTRAALMTGQHEFRSGITHTLKPREHMSLEMTTLPELLREAGYSTGFIGKWHLGGSPGYRPVDRGFDWTSTNPGGARVHFNPEIIRNGKRFKAEGYREDIYFDEAIQFIEDSEDHPFFCYLATYSPHTPLAAPESFIAPFREAGLNEKHSTYLAMIENIDYNFGRLIEYLEAKGLDENTIIIFMNDNGVTEGLDVYNAGMRGSKASIWEGGSRALSLWHWKGQWIPQTHQNLSAHIDVLPTLCELTGVEVPWSLKSDLEGFSMVPLLEAKGPISWHDERMLFHHVARWPSGFAEEHRYSMVAARRGDYLLLQSAPCGLDCCREYQSGCTRLVAVEAGAKTTTYAYGTAQYHWATTPKGQWRLFNVKEDSGCEVDLSADLPELASYMAARYDNWWESTFPVMIARGGDVGDPNVSKQASKAARQWKGPTSDKELVEVNN